MNEDRALEQQFLDRAKALTNVAEVYRCLQVTMLICDMVAFGVRAEAKIFEAAYGEHSTPTPAETKAKKGLFLKALATGRAPGCAAEAVGIARSTAYAWKTEDAAFAALWVEAVERSLDRLQTKVYDLALEGDMRAIEWELKWRRKDIYQNTEDRTPTSMTNYFLNVTQQEHFERLERLGLPVPVIESDNEEDYASNDADDSR